MIEHEDQEQPKPAEAQPNLEETYDPVATKPEKNLETVRRDYTFQINIGDDRYSIPLIMKKSILLEQKEIFLIEGFKNIILLKKLTEEWFNNFQNSVGDNKQTDSLENYFVETENQFLEKPMKKNGLLKIYLTDTIITYLNVKIYDSNIIRQSRLDDYYNLNNCLKLFYLVFQQNSDNNSQMKFSGVSMSAGDYKLTVDKFIENDHYEIKFLSEGMTDEQNCKNRMNYLENVFNEDLDQINSAIWKGYAATKQHNKEQLQINKNLLQKQSELSENFKNKENDWNLKTQALQNLHREQSEELIKVKTELDKAVLEYKSILEAKDLQTQELESEKIKTTELEQQVKEQTEILTKKESKITQQVFYMKLKVLEWHNYWA